MESPLGALRYYLQRWQGSHLWNEVPHLFSAPSPFFVVESVTIPHIDCHLHSPWPCDSSGEEAYKEMHDNKPLSPFLIYSNGLYGISTVTSISGTVLIFNIVVRELHTHADIFHMIADFHFLKHLFQKP